MSGDVAAGIVAVLAAMLLFGRGVAARGRGGAPVGRYALIWMAVFAGLFAVATLLETNR